MTELPRALSRPSGLPLYAWVGDYAVGSKADHRVRRRDV
jgi:hypothetical protein